MRRMMPRGPCWRGVVCAGLAATAFAGLIPVPAAAQSAAAGPPASAVVPPPAADGRQMLNRYCVTCHNERLETAGLDLERLDVAHAGDAPETWEKVIQKLRTATMPPSNRPQPPAAETRSMIAWLETSLDAASVASPDPGRTETLRRLNRTEYRNAIRDLLALDVDAASLLPPDESGHGFDNVTVGNLSPALLDRYLSAARKISRLAVGAGATSLEAEVIRVPPDTTQEEHVPGLPIGTRGGVLVSHTFAHDGEYDIQVRLARNRTGNIGGLRDPRPHEMEVLLDRRPIATFTIRRPEDRDDALLDSDLKVRVPVTAGPHELGVTFVRNAGSLLETERQPLQSHFNETRHPRQTPAVYQVTITGPYAPRGVGDTPSRDRVFVCRPAAPGDEEPCAREILETVMRRAYRRPVAAADLEGPLAFYREARAEGDFDAGIERALGAVLINPEFLFRVELDPDGVKPGEAYRISDLELASRLSFFLWSSIPDDELLDLAAAGRLGEPDVLDGQIRRMLADERSHALVENFAGQWLQLRKLRNAVPDSATYTAFDENLRDAMWRETELFLAHELRADRPVVNALRADYTFVNERLARHYGIPDVHGVHFRRVDYPDARRGGLLGHASLLTITSYANRTSPVVRGVWLLENFLGTPPAPPPPDVPSLPDAGGGEVPLSVRERLEQHRSNAICASCHNKIDPLGFALEEFDAIGRWRATSGAGTPFDTGVPIDASGTLVDGTEVHGLAGLRDVILSREDQFLETVTEKLLTYALGRTVEPHDMPVVRRISRHAATEELTWSDLVAAVAKSTPFLMRRSES